jgi:hypothetical protein
MAVQFSNFVTGPSCADTVVTWAYSAWARMLACLCCISLRLCASLSTTLAALACVSLHATYLAFSFETSSRKGKYCQTIGCFSECIYKQKTLVCVGVDM